ncbi:MAG: transcription termination factor Rho [Candidatus Shikimatogenerans sp. Ttur]|uniref:Transcription termination factor Rho n=1 Tax=Candidatus Shikimatogenerans sp. Ttur TaxID=3158569 RepID=A0AAU7ZXW0_9FLAO
MNINNLKFITFKKVKKIAKKFKIKNYLKYNKIELIEKIILYIKINNNNNFKKKYKNVINGGVLEIISNNKYGYLRSSDNNYLESKEDIYVSKKIINKYNIKNGDTIKGYVIINNKKNYFLKKLISINGVSYKKIKNRYIFKKLIPIFPNKKINLSGKKSNLSTRIIDIFTPIGKGQRALLVAPPKAGKTKLLKDCANCILANHNNIYQIFLLIDERPEEVTDIKRSVNCEIIYSTFDENIKNHIKISNIILQKSLRLVEFGYNVVILLDSITRLARAHNILSPNSGKTLSGGIDSHALQNPKKFFGAARNIENGGSLTIIASAIIETGSKMDDIIFEEFKGTGNMELQLDRQLANKRIFPAINILNSSTRRDDLLFNKLKFKKILNLRKFISNMDIVDSIEFVIEKFKKTKNNNEFIKLIN